jgi:3-hydroxyisobutyrate dehydrogenase-like beta-hydroxyacid dehydrogenase
MTEPLNVCLLGLGEVGSILAEDLLERSAVRIVVWDRLLTRADSAPAKKLEMLLASGRASAAEAAGSAARGCQVTISAVTAGQSLAAATSLLGSLEEGSWFVDLNSVSPSTKDAVRRAVAIQGARYVEVAVMSPILPRRSRSPMLLSGPNAREFVHVAQELGFDGMSVLSDRAGQASASKMCRSVMIKGMEALLAEALLAARYYGVEGEVLESLDNLFPGIDWQQKSHYMISRSVEHGLRRSEEMEEVARTVSEAGITPWMSEACVHRQRWASGFPAALQAQALNEMVDTMRREAGLPVEQRMDGRPS